MDTTTTPSREQALAIFADASKGITPAEPPTKALGELLAPYARALLEYRKNGYSVAQLVQILKSPKIGITLKEGTLKKYLADARKRSSHRARATKPATVPKVTGANK